MDVVAALQSSKPFARASKQAVADLAKTATIREIEHGVALWDAGQQPLAFSVINRGLIKIVRPLANGREAIVGLFGPRESIGDVAVMQGIPYPAAAIVCSSDARIIQIPRAEVLAHMTRHPELALGINQSMGDRVHALHAKLEILSAGGVEARLSSLLIDLSDRFGDEFENDEIVIPITLSRQDLADLVSTTYETTVRVMSKWKKSGILETTQDGFILKDVPQLRQFASSVLNKR